MVVRKRRKKNKMRGNRMHGGGNTKNRRGSGGRGGVGRAGSHKHKFSKYWMTFGIKRTLKAKGKEEAINLEQISRSIEKWLASGRAKKEGEMIVIDGSVLGFGKVLGKGEASGKFKILNAKASKGALKKILVKGGTAQGADEAAAEDEEFEVDEAEGEVEGAAKEGEE
ncbi:MAG TPA: uL15 family ribosomal protein [archaeon]|nr:uL15 family ribosomal protein [archaeon]